MNKDFAPHWDATDGARPDTVTTAAPSKSSHAVKQIVTIRLDVDMLEWFKADGPGYQTRINQVLRDHMEARRQAAPATPAA